MTSKSRGRIWLAIHFDAMRSAPRAYFTAVWWRLRGKRLRARGQFAPLLGATSKAYCLWLLREPNGEASDHGKTLPGILALINVEAGLEGLDETLFCCQTEGVPVLVVGGREIPNPVGALHDESGTEWLMMLSPGDMLTPGAVEVYRSAIAETDARVIYADDDVLDEAGRRVAPHFKPDWNGELFRHFDYLSGACAVRAPYTALAGDGTIRDRMYALLAHAAGKQSPEHIRRVLHHRRKRPEPRVPTNPPTPAQALPLVTIIIPTRNRVDLLRKCLSGIDITDYPQFEIIIVDNDSDDVETVDFLSSLDPVYCRVLHHAGAFNFGAINNRAVDVANGSWLCLLNNDIEVIEPGWLTTMVTQALREDVGAVGARLLYPDGRIQHAGVVLGIGGGAAHAHRLLQPNEEGYHYRHALPQFVSAVTAACLVVSRDRFRAVGGFDERDFPVAFNDVDLCMMLNRRGWQTLYEPRATLIHHESVSRGYDRDPAGKRRLARELAVLQARWRTGEMVDPYHHPDLSSFSERFVVRV